LPYIKDRGAVGQAAVSVIEFFYGLSAVLLVAPTASQPETLCVAHVRPDESLHGGQHLLDVIAVVVNPLVQQVNDAQLADRRVTA
jgi:hypothetical protein